jgi:hypothetical protein
MFEAIKLTSTKFADERSAPSRFAWERHECAKFAKCKVAPGSSAPDMKA